LFVLVFLLVLGFGVLVFAKVGRMDGAVVRKVRFSFGAVDGALFFDIFRFFRRKFESSAARMASVSPVLLRPLLLRTRRRQPRIRFRFFLGLFVFSLDEA